MTFLALVGNRVARAWRSIKRFFGKAEGPVHQISAWGGALMFLLAAFGFVWALAWPERSKTENMAENVTEDVQTPPDPPDISAEGPVRPPPATPPPRTECTPEEETEAFGILRASIESDVGRYMRFPGQPREMYRSCRLSGERYEIVLKMDVPGTLCDDRLRYEAYYSGGWRVDGTRVRLVRVGPEFAILLEQKRELRENPGMIPTCPR